MNQTHVLHHHDHVMRIYDAETAKRRFQNLDRLSTAQSVFAGLTSILILIFIFWQLPNTNNAWLLAIPTIHFTMFLSRFLAARKMKFKTAEEIDTKYIGKHKTENIRTLLDNIIRDNFSDKEEIPTIYIADDWPNNAIVVNSLFMNFDKHLNSIMVSRTLFDQLNANELSSIIGHEIGHFKSYISMSRRVASAHFLFLALSSYLVCAHVYSIAEANPVIPYMLFFLILRLLWALPTYMAQIYTEYLSDLYAGEKYGKLNSINALIKLYQMNDSDLFLTMQVARYIMDRDDFDIKDFPVIYQKVERRIGKKIHDKQLQESKADTILQDMSIKKKKVPKGKIKEKKRLLKQYLKTVEKMIEKETIDWDVVDSNHNGRIDKAEYDTLIEVLKENPKLPMFRFSGDYKKSFWFKTHPPLRDRILFLDKNCPAL